MSYDDPYRKAKMPRHGAIPLMTGGDPETWGENEHGFFSLQSGKFITKEEWKEWGYGSEPCIDIAFPGESTEKEEDE